MELLFALLIFLVVLLIAAYIVQNFILKAAPANIHPIIWLIFGILALAGLFRYVLHMV